MAGVLESFLLVVASEMGDKTQLLALILAARFRQPWAIMSGILVATLLNHALAAWAGVWIASVLPMGWQKAVLATVFIGFAAWILVPDKEDEEGVADRGSAFVTTLISFFIAEMGDKTQLATVALAARYSNLTAVVIGTTAGMLVADGLAVAFGEKLTARVPMQWVRRTAAFLFLLFGLAIAFVS